MVITIRKYMASIGSFSVHGGWRCCQDPAEQRRNRLELHKIRNQTNFNTFKHDIYSTKPLHTVYNLDKIYYII